MDTPQPNDEIHAQIGDNASGIAVGKQITQNVTQHFYNQPAPPNSPTLDFAAVEQRYRAQVVKYYNKLALTGLPERDPGLHEIALEQIFIKLNIELPQPAGPDFLGFDGEYHPSEDISHVDEKYEHKRHMREMARRRPTPVTLSVAEALQRHKQLVIIGGPGSGKTTLTRWLAVIFARREQAKTENLGAALAGDRLPIMLELRRFAEHFVTLSQQPAVPDLATEIASFISRHAYYPATPAAFIQQALTDGRCLILLDGLDEIADLGARQLLTDAIHSFIQHPTQPYRDNLLLVTSRPHGYQSISLSAFQECEVKPFSIDDVALFIRHWYATAYPDQEQSDAADLTTAIEANERVGELATNPLLCTIIAIVYRNNRVLPNRRVELYLKCCEALLDTWERNKAIKTSGLIAGYDWQTKLELLAPVAYWLHSEAERLAAPEADFVKQLAQVLIDKKLGDPAKAAQEAREFITLIRDRSGLLQGRCDDTLEFTHRTFQEYLAARHIAAQPYPDYIDLVMVHLHEAWWREVHLLVIGYLGSSSATATQASQLLNTILDCYWLPWGMLRSISIATMVPKLLLRLPSIVKDKGILSWFETGLSLIIILPFIVTTWCVVHLARWQWQRRLAWAHERELAFALCASLDCTPLGVSTATIEKLQKHAHTFLLRFIYDPAYRYTPLLEQHTALVTNLRRYRSNTKVVTTLFTALADSDRNVRMVAVYALGQLGQATPEIVTALLTNLADSDNGVRHAAARALGQLGQAAPDIVIALLTTLADANSDMRAAAAHALGQLDQATPEVVIALLTTLTDLDGDVRAAAVSALGQASQATPEVITALLTALSDSNRNARYAAASALGQLDQAIPDVITALLAALADANSDMQAAAAHALGQLGQATPEVVTALLTTLASSEISGRTRSARAARAKFARALGQLGQATPEVITALMTTLTDSDNFVRYAAANALGQLGQATPEVVTALLTNLASSDSLMRYAAAGALGQLKVKDINQLCRVLIALNKHLHHFEDNVRGAAIEASRKLVDGRPLPGYHWIPIRERLERQRRINRFGWWAWVVCGLVLAALVVVYLSAQLDANSLLVHFGAAVALITGLAAGVAQVLGWTLRNPYEKENQ